MWFYVRRFRSLARNPRIDHINYNFFFYIYSVQKKLFDLDRHVSIGPISVHVGSAFYVCTCFPLIISPL
jgi:hypothetical protein